MRGPLPTGEAGRPGPLIQAGGADTARVKGVPGMAAVAEPVVASRGRPLALRAADVRSGRTLVGRFFDFGFGRKNDGGHPTIMK